MITMFSDSMMTWLTPTMRPGMAEGTMTRQVICRGEQPTMVPNSRISTATPRSARVVMRTIGRSEEHTSELQSLMRISYAVFCLNKKKNHPSEHPPLHHQHILEKPPHI